MSATDQEDQEDHEEGEEDGIIKGGWGGVCRDR
jgi:hypothetical protein